MKVKVVDVRTAKEWTPFPGAPPNAGLPKFAAKPGHVLLIVEFTVKDLRTGKDERADFSDFEVEDGAGNKTKSLVLKANFRNVAFGVPDPTSIRLFRIGGVAFDIQAMTKGLSKP